MGGLKSHQRLSADRHFAEPDGLSLAVMNEPLIASRFRHFAEHECPGEPLYQALCHLAAADPALHSLLSSAPLEQQRPSLWLAAVHAALLATPDTERPGLADYYPNLYACLLLKSLIIYNALLQWPLIHC
jgi:hypothetical protein